MQQPPTHRGNTLSVGEYTFELTLVARQLGQTSGHHLEIGSVLTIITTFTQFTRTFAQQSFGFSYLRLEMVRMNQLPSSPLCGRRREVRGPS